MEGGYVIAIVPNEKARATTKLTCVVTMEGTCVTLNVRVAISTTELCMNICKSLPTIIAKTL
jgi:hypothetical protein